MNRIGKTVWGFVVMALLELGIVARASGSDCYICTVVGEYTGCSWWPDGAHVCDWEIHGYWCIQYGNDCVYTISTPVMRVFLADGTVPSMKAIGDGRGLPERGCGGILLKRSYQPALAAQLRQATEEIVL
jgi:hypothetical protein